MNTPLLIAAIAAIIALVVVMVAGIVSMAKGGEFNKKYGNKLMQWRVYLQGAALGLLALSYFVGA